MSHRRIAALQPAIKYDDVGSPGHKHQKMEDEGDASNLIARKRVGINASGACEPCRKGKRRCDGEKPRCSACSKRGIEPLRCVYDQLEGFSRAGTLKHNAQKLEAERDSLRGFVTDLLNLAPGTTVGEGVRLTEKHGFLLPTALRIEADKKAIQCELLVAMEGKDNGSRSLITPGSEYLTGSEGDTLHPSPTVSSASPKTTTSSVDFDMSHCSQEMLFEHGGRSLGDDGDHGNVMLRHRYNGSRPVDTFSQQSLRDLCDRMAHEDCNSRFTRRFQDGEPTATSPLNGYLQVYGYMPISPSYDVTGWPLSSAMPEPQVLDLSIPLYMIQPLLLDDESPLSRTAVEFVALARTRVRQGWSLSAILGPIDFDVSRITSAGTGYDHQNDEFSVPAWAISVVMTFSNTTTIVKLTLVLQLARLMRWFIAPTPENYNLIPDSQKPTPLQRMVPHKAEYDFLMLPAMRDALITRPREYVQTYLDSVKCTWMGDRPHIKRNYATNSVTVTTEFEQHVSNLDNWYFGTPLLQIFPEIASKCNHDGFLSKT